MLPIKSQFVGLCALVICGTASASGAVTTRAQREMEQAIVKLEIAKYARLPLDRLEEAKSGLEKANRTKDGECAGALLRVQKAIEAARQNDQTTMQAHREAAIRDIRADLQAPQPKTGSPVLQSLNASGPQSFGFTRKLRAGLAAAPGNSRR